MAGYLLFDLYPFLWELVLFLKNYADVNEVFYEHKIKLTNLWRMFSELYEMSESYFGNGACVPRNEMYWFYVKKLNMQCKSKVEIYRRINKLKDVIETELKLVEI